MTRLLGWLLLVCLCPPSLAGAAEIRVAVTTSFHNSGLSDILIPQAKAALGFDVRLIVVGTGHALRLGRAGDVDAILVHSREAEDALVAEGFANHRREIMYNDFVIIGPSQDPAGAAGATSAADALTKIAGAQSLFVSRGDESGTHQRELVLWRQAGKQPANFKTSWYRAVGASMGAALNTASAMNAYILSDRASWLNFDNKGGLKLHYSGDPALLNQYAYLAVSPKKHPHVRHRLADLFGDWLASDRGQSLIGNYTLNGEKLFMPNANEKAQQTD